MEKIVGHAINKEGHFKSGKMGLLKERGEVMKRSVFLILVLVLMFTGTGVAASVAAGEKIFKKYCTRCHAEDGSVSEYGRNIKPQPARDLRTNRLFVAPKELPIIIKYGVYGREMPRWEDVLSDAEILDVAAYVRTLKYTPDPKAGEKLFKEKCFGCHGAEGAAKKLFNAPDLEMSPLQAFDMGRVVRFGRHGTIMSPKERILTNPVIADMVEYLQSIKK